MPDWNSLAQRVRDISAVDMANMDLELVSFSTKDVRTCNRGID
jgi:hypothetical protein